MVTMEDVWQVHVTGHVGLADRVVLEEDSVGVGGRLLLFIHVFVVIVAY